MNIILPYNKILNNIKDLRRIIKSYYSIENVNIIVVEWGEKPTLEDLSLSFKYLFIRGSLKDKNRAINCAAKLCDVDSKILISDLNFILPKEFFILNDNIKYFFKDHTIAILFKNRKFLFDFGLYPEDLFLLSHELLIKKIKILFDKEEENISPELLKSNWIKNDEKMKEERRFLDMFDKIEREKMIKYIKVNKSKLGIKNRI